MPVTLEMTLWGLIDDEQFSEVKTLRERHPEVDFINARNPENGRNLPIHLTLVTMTKGADKPTELLLSILTDAKMDWAFENKTITAASALLDALMVEPDFTIIKGLKDVPGFILSNNVLTYDLAVGRLKKAESLYQTRVRTNKPPAQIDEALAKIEKCQIIVALIRDITMLHAIKTDNADLLDRLEKAGGKTLEDLGDFGGNINPMFLIGVKQPNPRIKAWRAELLDRRMAEREEQSRARQGDRDRIAFFQSEVVRINAEHDAKAIEILERAGKERLGRIDAVVAESIRIK